MHDQAGHGQTIEVRELIINCYDLTFKNIIYYLTDLLNHNMSYFNCLFVFIRLANKMTQLKAIYGELLRKSSNANDYSHLLRVVTQISELNL